MGSNEEYLDKLLQSVTKDEKTSEPVQHEYDINMTDDELLTSLIEMYSEELADFKENEIIHKDENEEVSESSAMNETVVETETEPLQETVTENFVEEILPEESSDNMNDTTSAEESETVVEEVVPAEQYTSPSGVRVYRRGAESRLLQHQFLPGLLYKHLPEAGP